MLIDEKTLSSRKFVAEVLELAKKYELNCFIVTDGASGIAPNHDWSDDITE